MRISDWSSDVCSSDLQTTSSGHCGCLATCRKPATRQRLRRRGLQGPSASEASGEGCHLPSAPHISHEATYSSSSGRHVPLNLNEPHRPHFPGLPAFHLSASVITHSEAPPGWTCCVGWFKF